MGAATKRQPNNSQDFIPLNTDAAPQPPKRKKPSPAAAVGSDSEPSTSSSSRVVYIGFVRPRCVQKFAPWLLRERVARCVCLQHPSPALSCPAHLQLSWTLRWRQPVVLCTFIGQASVFDLSGPLSSLYVPEISERQCLQVHLGYLTRAWGTVLEHTLTAWINASLPCLLASPQASSPSLASSPACGCLVARRLARQNTMPSWSFSTPRWQRLQQRFRTVQWRAVERRRHDKERSPQEHAVRIARLIKRDAQRAARIKAAGIDYEYTPVKQQVPLKPKRTVIEMTD
ncbi:RRM domain-containing protein [Haematococcus lacustris]|uniref:RRM domain-containing protein n=1 Tax=Haematococcus lacustris TaxID=44745 RepID=A0A699ZN80_HAELA|nr:RRM domain-containing protein [Haematococcus lacustris]